MGPDLMDQMRKQALRFGTQLVTDDITEMKLDGEIKTLVDGSGNTLKARAVILAMGSAYKEIGLTNEKRLSGRGVSWCATCDGFFFRDQVIAVVGGGDSAMEEANFLTKFASKVVLIHRREELRASKIMAERALNHPKIQVLWSHALVRVEGNTVVSSVVLQDLKTQKTHSYEAGGVFFAIGHQPNTDFLQGQVALHPNGYIQVKPGTSYTSLEGVFAAGDV